MIVIDSIRVRSLLRRRRVHVSSSIIRPCTFNNLMKSHRLMKIRMSLQGNQLRWTEIVVHMLTTRDVYLSLQNRPRELNKNHFIGIIQFGLLEFIFGLIYSLFYSRHAWHEQKWNKNNNKQRANCTSKINKNAFARLRSVGARATQRMSELCITSVDTLLQNNLWNKIECRVAPCLLVLGQTCCCCCYRNISFTLWLGWCSRKSASERQRDWSCVRICTANIRHRACPERMH